MGKSCPNLRGKVGRNFPFFVLYRLNRLKKVGRNFPFAKKSVFIQKIICKKTKDYTKMDIEIAKIRGTKKITDGEGDLQSISGVKAELILTASQHCSEPALKIDIDNTASVFLDNHQVRLLRIALIKYLNFTT